MHASPLTKREKKFGKIRLQKITSVQQAVQPPSPATGVGKGKQCQRCGRHHVQEARFCIQCGIPLSRGQSTKPPPSPRPAFGKRLWYERPEVLLLRALVLLSLIALLGTITHGNLSFSVTSATSASHESGNTFPLIPSPHPFQWITTQTFSGESTHQTENFLVGTHWRILWRCDPASVDGGDYLLMVEVDNPDGSIVDRGVEMLCQQHNTQGVNEEYGAGQVSLHIISIGTWTVEVQEWKLKSSSDT